MIQLELLWALQCIDREIISLKKDTSSKEIYNRLSLIKSEYVRFKAMFEKGVLELDENNKTAQRLNADLKVLDQKVKDNNEKMYDECDSIKIIDSLQTEIDECKLKIDSIENEVLGIIDANERLNKDIGDKKRKLQEIKREFETLKGEYSNRVEENKQRLQELNERRKKLTGEIDHELIKQYDDIASRKNNPVSQVKDITCLECSVKLNAMLYDALKKRNQLCKCDNCGRILYIE